MNMNIFQGQNNLLALATVMGTLGGFQNQPSWFKSLSKYTFWQILMGAVLVYQGGGNQNLLYSLLISTIFYTIMSLSNYIFITNNNDDASIMVNPITSEEDSMPSTVTTSQTPGETFFTGYQ
jgi:uncharacterized membrane protein YjjP (DUF1212 family)